MRAGLVAAIERQLEAIAFGERIDVMAHAIEIRKAHFRADRRDQDLRLEREIALGDLIRPIEGDRPAIAAVRREADDRMTYRRARRIGHADGHVGGVGEGGAGEPGAQSDQRAHEMILNGDA